MKKSFAKIVAIIMVLSMTLTGCGKDTKDIVTNTPEIDDSIVIISWMASESLDPTSGITTDKTVVHQLFDTLVKFDANYEIVPSLAESWIESEDGMSVTFKLRQDATFHDGSKITADDAVYSNNRLMETATGASYANYVTGMEKIDDHTIKVNKAFMFSNVFNAMVEFGYVLPQKLVEADPQAFALNPIGSGPYKFVKKDVDGSIVMEAYNEYYGDVPVIKNLTVKPPMDFATAAVALENNEVDVVFMMPKAQRDQLQNNEKIEILNESSWSQMQLVFPGEPFKSNAKLREAVYHGINPENVFLMGASSDGTLATDIFASKVMGEYSGYLNLKDRYNPELAKKLLVESGYDTSQKIVFSADPSTASIFQVIQQDLKDIGLNIEIEQLDLNTLYGKLLKGDLPVVALAFGTNLQNTEDILNFYTIKGDTSNIFGSKSPEYDTLVGKIMEEKDVNLRKVLVKQALTMLKDNNIIVPFYDWSANIVYNKKLDNVNGAAAYVFYASDVTLK